MKRSSPMRLGRRTPSPSSSASSSSSISSSSVATLSQSRSLPVSFQPRQGESEMPGRGGGGGGGGGALPAIQGRAFRRAVSDRAVGAAAAPNAAAGDLMDVDVGGGVGSATLSRIQQQPEENGRRVRYDKVGRVEDLHQQQPSVRRSVSASGEGLRFPSGGGSGDLRKARSGSSIAVESVDVQCGQTVDGNVLRQSIPVAVKVEPVDHQLDNHVQQLNLSPSPVQKTSRQFKHKAAEMFASLPSFAFGSGRSPPTSRPSRQQERESGSRGADWLQLLMDVILWRDFPRSTLVFGVGAFALLSASFMRDIHLNIVTTLSYLALAYLSAVFFRINILRRLPSSGNWRINETAALEVTRNMLPAVNAVLLKLSQLFSGDPEPTLKVAAALWCIAHSVYWISPWNMLRLAFFGAFLVPRCYVAYSAQAREQGTRLVSHLSSVWDSCPHKKVVVVVAGVLIWNFLTMSSRLWIAFFALVALRKFQSRGVEVPPPVVLKKEY